MTEVPSGIELIQLIDSMPPSKMGDAQLKAELIRAQSVYDEASLDYHSANTADQTKLKAKLDEAYLKVRLLRAAPNANSILDQIISESRNI